MYFREHTISFFKNKVPKYFVIILGITKHFKQKNLNAWKKENHSCK